MTVRCPACAQIDPYGRVAWIAGEWVEGMAACHACTVKRLAAPPMPKHHSPGVINIPVPLHVGFIGIPETQEMVSRLAEKRSIRPAVARSKLSQANHYVHPIDVVAHRVAPEAP